MAVQSIIPADGSTAAALDHYRRQLHLPSIDVAVETLARALSIGPIPGPPERLIARPGPRPSLAVEGIFDEADRAVVASHGRAVVHACATLHYVSAGEATELAAELGRKLTARFGQEAVRGFDYQAIPSGGRRVLEMLAAQLGLEPPAAQATSQRTDTPLVLVDDCALTGARLGGWLRNFPDRPVIVAHLLSHPSLRAAIRRAEPRVMACVAAADLCGVGGDLTHFIHAGDTVPRYWVGLTEHVAFPWNEPDRVVRNPVTGRVERAWNVLPPELCSKNARPGAAAIPIEREDPVPAPLTGAIGPSFSRTRYRLFGRIVVSGFPHGVPLPEAGPVRSAEPDLRITVDRAGLSTVRDDEPCSPQYVSPYREPSGAPRLIAYDTRLGDLLRFAAGADFLVQDDRIAVTMEEGCDVGLAELHLLGVVLAWWLERRGVLVFHGSGVSVGGTAVGFLGAGGAGKSVAAGLMLRSGAALVTDDALALEARPGGLPLALPSQGSLRLWPEAADFVGVASDDLPRIHPNGSKRRLDLEGHGVGLLAAEPVPLAALFLLEREVESGAEPAVVDVPQGQAVVELARHSFLARMQASPRARVRRFPRLAGLANAVPMKRVRLPASPPAGRPGSDPGHGDRPDASLLEILRTVELGVGSPVGTR